MTSVVEFVIAGALLQVPTPIYGQSTQGLLAGRVTDSVTGRPLANGTITCVNESLNSKVAVSTNRLGYYYLPQLSPGSYNIRVEALSYQPREANHLELPVAGRLDVNWELRPLSDVWEAGEYRSLVLPGSRLMLTFYGPDVDASRFSRVDTVQPSRGALDSSVSQTVDPKQIATLPLAGRDVYTMLVAQPGVTADTTTARSLGLSTNGQRPSSSNFLLDGIESNNYLIGGPLSPIAPEMVQEYRISTNNFSAEYGGTSGYIANAVTRAGGQRWHALSYFNLKNTALNANDFQSNLAGQPRTALHELNPGLHTGGPLRRNLFGSFSWDYLRSRSFAQPVSYRLPTTALLALTPQGSLARKLLTEYPGPVLPGPALTSTLRLSPPVSVNRHIGMARVDRVFSGGASRLMGRFVDTGTDRPDFQWTPFTAFTSGIEQTTRGLVLAFATTHGATAVNEVRFGYTRDDLALGRAHPAIPLLTAVDGTTLPGSTVFSRFVNDVSSWQVLDNFTRTHGRHLTVLGGGVLLRGIAGILTAGAEGQYAFANVSDFASDKPNLFRIPLDRQVLPSFVIPRFDRDYRLNGHNLFVQDTFRVSRRFTVNYGLRYESFGSPVNTGEFKDSLVQLGSGPDFSSRLASARLVRPIAGDERLYAADRTNFAPRVGASWSVPRTGLVLRAAWGIFYDRIFDNVWQNIRNNNFVLPTAFSITATQTDYLSPVASLVGSYQGQPVSTIFADPATQLQRAPTTMFEPGLRTPYTQSVFVGIQQAVTASWGFETYYASSRGRRLLTSDAVNRTATKGIGPVFYRGNQGSSSYHSLNTVVRYRASWAQFQAAYTWSHAIDNQSEILRGDYFNLSASRVTSTPSSSGFSAFATMYDSSGDRGNADFDQRQNLFMYSAFTPPGPRSRAGVILRHWTISHLAAFRAGAPFTVSTTSPVATGILNQRANLVNESVLYGLQDTPVAGGVRLLNRAAFTTPAAGTLGNTGRNAFRGPGFWNADLSLARSFPLTLVGEAGLLTLRADAFNLLNHANLNMPTNILVSSTFGIARFGRALAASGLPLLSPVNDTSRQFQMIVRLQF
jgi:hypothetical protein